MKKIVIATITALLLISAGAYLYQKNRQSYSENYLPLEQRKTVEAYFIEHMRVSPTEAQEMATNGVDLRVSKTSTVQGIVGNLYYYGFIDDQAKFNKLLEVTKDTTPGDENSIKIGTGNTIDINSHYYLNYQMTEEEIADTLLNRAKFANDFSSYNYLFMPSGRGGPSQRSEE